MISEHEVLKAIENKDKAIASKFWKLSLERRKAITHKLTEEQLRDFCILVIETPKGANGYTTMCSCFMSSYRKPQ